MNRYRLTLKHDSGLVRIIVSAPSKSAACLMVCNSENCPMRAILRIKKLSWLWETDAIISIIQATAGWSTKTGRKKRLPRKPYQEGKSPEQPSSTKASETSLPHASPTKEKRSMFSLIQFFLIKLTGVPDGSWAKSKDQPWARSVSEVELKSKDQYKSERHR